MTDTPTAQPVGFAAEGARASSGPPPRHLIWTLSALASFGPLSTDMYLPGLPSLTRSLHASAAASNLTLTASVLGIALGQLIAGPASDQLGRRRPLLIGLLGFAFASVLCAVTPSIFVLIVVRFAQGLAGGAGIVIARAVIRDLYDGAQAAKKFAVLMMIGGVAPIFAPLVGGGLLAVSSWRGVFVALALIGAFLFVAALRGVPETLPVSQRHRGGLRATARMLGALARDRSFAPYCAAFAFSFGAMFAWISGGSYAVENVYHASPQLFSLLFAVNASGYIGLARVSSLIVGRFGPARLLRVGLVAVCVTSLAALVLTTIHSGIAPLLIALFGVVAAQGLVLPNAVAAAMSDRPEALGSASALIGLTQFGLGALLAPLVGLGGTHDALPMVIVMAACGAVALGVNLTLS